MEMATNDKTRIDGRRVAKVYVWWDEDQVANHWRYDFDEVDGYDRIDHVLLPEGFDLYTTELGETLAYDTTTEPREANEYHDAWRIFHDGKCYRLCDAHRVSRLTPACMTIDATA